MKKSLLALAICSTLLSVSSIAEFKVKVFLEPNALSVAPPNEITGDVNISPSTINRGESSMMSWDYDFISSLDVSGGQNYSTSQKAGSISLNPLRTTDYKVDVDNGNVKTTKDLKLTVIQPDPTITFTSDKYKIGEGQTARLTWNVGNSEKATIDQGIGSIVFNSHLDVTPADDTTYTLHATGYYEEKEDSKSITIDVIKNSLINAFTVNKNKFTVGESAIFNWNVNDSEALVLDPYGNVDKTATTQTVPLNTLGDFDYTLTTTSFNGSTKSSTLSVSVYGEPTLSAYTVNDLKTVNVETGDDLVFKWTQTNGNEIKLDNTIVTGNTSTLKAPAASKNYTLQVVNGAGKSVQDTVNVNIVLPVAVTTFTAPSAVFVNYPFALNWNGTGVEKYELSGTTGSGASSSEDLAKATTKSVTPTTAGSYTYTLKASNLAGKSDTKTTNVSVEADPTFTGFTVNGQTTITVSPSAALNFVAVGNSSGSILQGRDSSNSTDTSLPSTANSSAGSTVYRAIVQKTLNGVKRTSDSRSVVVNVVNDPSITTFTAASNVFANAAFTMAWNGTNVTNYKIKANSAGAGISTSDVDLGTSSTTSITPTAAGTYTYTLTATNAAGVVTTATKSVVVEADPTFTGYTVNGATSIEVVPSTILNYAVSGNSSGSTLTGRNAANTANASNANNAPTTAGKYTYYGAVYKTLSGVTRYSDVKSVEVNVLNPPSVDTLTGPTNVFVNAPFTLNWTGTDAVSYSITSGNTGSGLPLGGTNLGNVNTYTVTPSYSGTYNYIITAKNKLGQESGKTLVITVEDAPKFTTYTVNGSTDITVSPSTALNYAVTGNTAGSTLIGRNSGNTSVVTNPTTAPASSGTYTYYGAVGKTLNSVTRYSQNASVTVKVVEAPTIGTVTAPTTVFSGSTFTMSWSGANVSTYKIKSNSANSGIATSDVDLSTATSRAITPTAAGTYTYTITGVNEVGVTTTSTKSVTVEADPTFTGFTVNGSAAISVAPSAALTYTISGNSTGSAIVGRNAGNTADSSLPSTASSTAGATTYYAAVSKTLNSVTRYSAVRSVAVTVVAAPTVATVTAPTPINLGSAFTLSWTGTGAASYTVSANTYSGSGLSAATNVGTATSRSITPTAAGTFTYTVTATNSVGITAARTVSVKVENWIATTPTYTAWVNSGAVYNCTAWTQDASTVNSGTAFTQTRTCSQNQTRTRQDKQTETATDAIRNNGAAVTESQTISVSQSQAATGTKPTAVCAGDANSYWSQLNGTGWSATYVTLVFNGTAVMYEEYASNQAVPTSMNNGVNTFTRGTVFYTSGFETRYTICRQ